MTPTIDPEIRDLIPPLTDDERTGLEASILRDGCRDALVAWQGVLVDGHHRLAICEEHGLEYRTVELDRETRDEALLWVIENQHSRRNLALIDRAALAVRYLEIESRQAAQRCVEAGASGVLGGRPRKGEQKTPEAPVPQGFSERAPQARDRAAKAVGISGRTLDMAKKVIDECPPETIEKIRSGDTSIKREYGALRTAERRQERTEKIIEESTAGDRPKGLDCLASVILADPPWRYEGSETSSREIENHYPTMSLEEIKAIDVGALSTTDAVLYLWATSPKLAEALEVMGSWGFVYRSSMVWIKDRVGMGYWTRGRHELILIGTRGTMPPPAQSDRTDSVIEAPRGRHSEKPASVYNLLERQWPDLPKLELFARSPRDGWARWGHEA